MDTASSQPGEIILTLPSAQPSLADVSASESGISDATTLGLPPSFTEELWLVSEAESHGITQAEFITALAATGAKHHFNQAPETIPTPAQQTAFYRGLHLSEFALAQACALGRDSAWQRFFSLYRVPLAQAAIAITGSATLGHDLADSLYAELFGLAAPGGERRSPLASYSGRGSLMGWLRTTLAQRHIDHHRRTYRETPLEDIEGSEAAAVPTAPATPQPAELDLLVHAVAQTLDSLAPEDRFLLVAYFLDQQTLLQIARLLHVHEATVSRKLKRLTSDLRKQLMRNLQADGLSKRAAEEALGADPRDLEINLRELLQTSQIQPFSDRASHIKPASIDQRATSNQQPTAK